MSSMSYFKDTTINGNLIVNANTIALGFQSGNGTGLNNVNVGSLAGGFQTGSYNVNIGYDAGANGIIQYTGTNNTVVGYNSGMNSSTTTNGTAIGANSLVDMSGTALGAGATAIGTNNIAIGVNATTGNWGNSMAIGTNSQVTSSVHLGDFNLQTTNVDNSWKCVTFGSNIPIAGGKKGLFAAVSYDGSYNRVINSTDAMNWNVQSVLNADPWNCIISGTTSTAGTYPSETPIFVAVSPIIYDIVFTSRVSTSDIKWTSITYGAPSTGTNAGKGLFAAIGNSSTSGIMTSLDGVTWTAPTSSLTSLNWTSIAYGNGTFVAVASNPTINSLSVVSTDGISWSSAGVTTRTSSFTSVVYGNTFAAVDVSGVSTSPTGVTWTRQTTILGNSVSNAGNTPRATYTGITYGAPSTGTHAGKNMFVAVGQQDTSGILTCVADGVTTWRRARPGTISAKNWTGITYGSPSTGQYAGGNIFVAVASNDTSGIMTSTDGSFNWTLRSCPSANWNGITYGNGLFVAVSSSGTGNRVMSSTDAINWLLQTSAADNSWNSITYGGGTFAAVGMSGTGNRIMTYTPSLIRVMISDNGNTWSTANMTGIDQNNWVSVTSGRPASGSYTGGNIFIAASNSGSTNRLMLSQNGNGWVTSGITGVPDISYSSITYGNGTFVAVADASYATPIILSSTGTTWTSVAAPVNNNWSSVIYGTVSAGLYDGSGVFVAVAYGGTTNRVMTSINAGVTWVSRQCPVSDWSSVNYGTDSNGKGYFVAVSYSGFAMASTDTVNWYLVPTPAKNRWSGITYGVPTVGSYMGQGVFAAVSTTGTNRVMTSSFGDSTTVSSLSMGNKAYANGESTIAIGEGARVSGSQLGQFTLQTGATVANSWRSVISGVVTATGRTIFVAVAAIGTNRVYYSDDGVTWTATPANYDTNVWQSITYGVPTMGTYANIGLFVAVASTVTPNTGTAVMTSIDGITWTTQNTTGFDYPWFSVTFGQISTGPNAGMSAFVAVAYAGANRLMWSYDGVNWLNTNTSVTNTAVWASITYGVPSSGRYQGLGAFVAIANSGAGSGTRLMFSTDLSGWTTIISAATDLSWNAITYGTPSTGRYKDQGVFVAVSKSGKGNRVMTTTDLSTCSVDATLNNTFNTSTYDNSWNAIGYGNGYFIAVGGVGGSPLISRVMTSTDAINWTLQKTPGDLSWNAITYGVPSIGQYAGQGIFVALSSGSGSNRVMTAVFTDVYKNNSAAIGNGALTTGNNSMAIGVGSAVLGDNSVAYGVGASVTGNSSIAMGSSAIVKSPFHLGDWKAYTTASGNRIVAVTYGNGLFVAVLASGTSPAKVITSPDGINWTFRQVVGNITWHTVTYGIPSTGQYAGQGLFVVLSWGNTPGLMTSPDGINWTVRSGTIADNKYFLRIEYGNGVFVGFASNADIANKTFFVYSTDGITWNNCIGSPPTGNLDWWNATAYGNGYFVALGQYAPISAYRSPNGINWAAVTLPITARWQQMAFGNGVFVVLTWDTTICMVSPDGLNWTVYQTSVIQNWHGMSFGNGLFVAVSVTSPDNVSMVSPDGINWTVKHTPIDSDYRGIAYGTVNGVGTFVSFRQTDTVTSNVMVASFEDTQNSIAIGDSASVNGSGSIAIGANAKVNRSQLSSFINRVTPIDTLNVILSDVDSGIPSTGPYQGQTLFIAVSSSITGGGINNRIIISLDTVNWFPVSVPIDLAYSAIVWGIPSTGQYAGQGLFVIVASTITASQIITSPDGITWTIRTSPVSGFALQDIAFGNGTFVAVSNVTAGSTRVLRSPDGITWSYPTSLTNTTTNTWVSITFGNGIFVAVGTTVTPSPNVTECTMYSADNGNSWTLESSLSNRVITGIAYGIASTQQLQGQGVFVNVTNDGYIRYSKDLSKYGWSSGQTPDNVPIYTHVTYGNGTFIAISSNNYIATSTSGLGWTYSYYVGSMSSMIYGIPSSGPFVNQSVFVMATSATTGTKIASANFIDTNVSNSIAIGNGAIASGNNSIAIGNGAISTIDNIVVIGNIHNTMSVPGKPFFNGGFVQGVFIGDRCTLVPKLTNANSMNITFVGTLNGTSSNGGLALPYQAYGQYFVILQMNLEVTSATANQSVAAIIIPSTDSANVDRAGFKTYTYRTTGVYTGEDTFSITAIHTYSPSNQLQYLYFYAGVSNLSNRPFVEDGQYSFIQVVQM